MGKIVLAHDARIGGDVAVKQLRPELEQQRELAAGHVASGRAALRRAGHVASARAALRRPGGAASRRRAGRGSRAGTGSASPRAGARWHSSRRTRITSRCFAEILTVPPRAMPSVVRARIEAEQQDVIRAARDAAWGAS
jgi:hypothetical protein